MAAKRGRKPVKRRDEPTEPVQLYAPLTRAIVELARAKGQAVCDFVEDSPLYLWALSRHAKLKRQKAAEADEADRRLAEALARKKGRPPAEDED